MKSNQPLTKKQRIQQVINSEVPEYHREYFMQILAARRKGRLAKIEKLYSRLPVPVDVFINSPSYANSAGILYPEIMKALQEVNTGEYTEAVFTGSIGSGKTTLALYTTLYQLYLLSCMRDPHSFYGLDPSSEILFIFQSINGGLAKTVEYERFKSMVETSPYFAEHFSFDNRILSMLKFPNRIEVKPISGEETGAIGQNVIGGVIDEVNFMAIIEGSKQSRDGGTYNQAIALYNSVSRRRKSRFMKRGKSAGILCLVSSKRYPNQFTDIKTAEAKKEIEETGSTTCYVFDKTTWQVMPADKFSGDWFKLYTGDQTKKPRILVEGEELTEEQESRSMLIPEEYRKEFETDIMNALRDIAGVSTLATHPYLVDTDLVTKCFSSGHQSILSRTAADFILRKLQIYPDRIENKDDQRWIHIDLGVTSDAAGFVMGHVSGFTSVSRGDSVEILPIVQIDCSLAVEPPKGGEIQFHKIRSLIYKLSEMGVPIKWISFDSFQSVDSLQILKNKGYTCGRISMDRTTEPYDILKSALYDGRVVSHEDPKLQLELATLERDLKKGKIDHPAGGTKDIADSLAGVVSGLTMRSEIWHKHGVNPSEIPKHLMTAKDNMKVAEEHANEEV